MKSKIGFAALGISVLLGVVACSKAPTESKPAETKSVPAASSVATTNASSVLPASSDASGVREKLKNLPKPDTCHTVSEKRYIGVTETAWKKWLADFSARSFTPSAATFAPGLELHGDGYSINFHEKSVILNVNGVQQICERTTNDEAFLKGLYIAPKLRLSLSPMGLESAGTETKTK